MRAPRLSRWVAGFACLAFSITLGACGGSEETPTWTISGTVSGAASQGVIVALGGPRTASATTDSAGHYAFSGLSNGSYTVTPSLSGYTFTPPNRSVSVSGGDVGGQDFTATALPHVISGTVSGAVSEGVTVTLGGAHSATTTTDGTGHYAFAGLADGSYTVTPSLSGYTFSPASRSVSVSGADVAGQDFTAMALPYVISGTVSGAVSQGVTVTLGGAHSATTTTDGTGHYAFAGLADGSYTVTPSLSGYTFAPASRSVSVSGADVAGQGFTATALPHVISGTVSGAVSEGVTVTLSGGRSAMTTTDGTGHYAFTGLADGSYTVTPSLSGYTFSPASRSVSVSGADVAGQDFTATALPYVISGTVSGAVSEGVTVTLGGGRSAKTTTDSTGHYAFAGLADGSYTVTPSLSGYTFSPASRSVSVSGADVAGQDFTATAVPHVISGTVSGAVSRGVTVTLGGGRSAKTTTDCAGRYRFTGLANGSYTVTPSLAGFTFAPASRSVSVSGADVAGQDFTATAVPHAISGTVSGAVSQGVTVTLGGARKATTTTDSAGRYSFTGLANGSYTVQPKLSGYKFSPDKRSVSLSGADVAGMDFAAAVHGHGTFIATDSMVTASGSHTAPHAGFVGDQAGLNR